MTKLKKRIIISVSIIVAVLIVALGLLTIPSAETDIKILGDDYKYHLYDKYSDDLVHYCNMANWVYDEDTGFYDDYYDITHSIPADEEGKDKVIDYKGRKLYFSIYCKYRGEEIKITFEGTKRIFDVYSWKMVENELFPIKDSNAELAYEMEYAEKF